MQEPEKQQVRLMVLESEPLARLLAQRLEGAGVPCLVRALGVGPGGWGAAANLPHALYVWASDEERARQLLELVPGEVIERENMGTNRRQARSTLALAALVILALALLLSAAGTLFGRVLR